jgi:shikimate 5-dehydrogenase
MKYLVVGSGGMAVGAIHDRLHLKNTQEIHLADREEAALTRMKLRFPDNILIIHKADAKDKQIITNLMRNVDGVSGHHRFGNVGRRSH